MLSTTKQLLQSEDFAVYCQGAIGIVCSQNIRNPSADPLYRHSLYFVRGNAGNYLPTMVHTICYRAEEIFGGQSFESILEQLANNGESANQLQKSVENIWADWCAELG